MKIQKWITISRRGVAKLTKNKPSLNWDEVAMKLNIEIPNSVFERPQLQANIKIDGELNFEFDYQVTEKIENVLSSLPNVHLLNVDIIKEETNKED